MEMMGRKMVVMVVVLVMVLEGSEAAFSLCDMNEDGLLACKPTHWCCLRLGLILILPWNSLLSATSPLLLLAKVWQKSSLCSTATIHVEDCTISLCSLNK
ncbi:hypothetical protein F0562_021688 [Nyssa sinensis]|uniref:Bifunctional inhibitor/plant lipid transfer protein/seed storage helical domain-containing protein n=1 Tax=Nyssa sinensis TaxID=561372 RepID=A0A5J5BLS2_9ASTE|nr:hypothetical protein F0562_021688 [Nyssa sinensis]